MGQHTITQKKTHMLKNLDKGSKKKRTVYLIGVNKGRGKILNKILKILKK